MQPEKIYWKISKHLKSYSSVLITCFNVILIFWIIRFINTSGAKADQLADIVLLIGLFPVLTLGYPTWVVAEVSKSKKLSYSVLKSAFHYLFLSSIILGLVSFACFNEVWWICSAYPVVFVVTLARGYFEAFERFWLSAGSKLCVSSVLLGGAFYVGLNNWLSTGFIIICLGLAALIIFSLLRKSKPTQQVSVSSFQYSLQALNVFSFFFIDRLLIKFIAAPDVYVSFILVQESLYKIISAFMIISIFHFPEINSTDKDDRKAGLLAYKLQAVISIILIILFSTTPLRGWFFAFLGLNQVAISILLIAALFFPVCSMLLQKITLSYPSGGISLIFVCTIIGSTAVGISATYFYQDPYVSMALRGFTEVFLLGFFLRSKFTSSR